MQFRRKYSSEPPITVQYNTIINQTQTSASEILNVGSAADIILLHIFVKVISCQPNVQYQHFVPISFPKNSVFYGGYMHTSISNLCTSTLCPSPNSSISFPKNSVVLLGVVWSDCPFILKLIQNFLRMCTRPAPRTQCAIKFRWISSFYIVNLCKFI